MTGKILRTIEKYRLLDGVNDVCVALSGGADSVTLLYKMLELKSTFGYSLSAVHVNHNLRGEESDADERFVKKLCADLGVPLYCESVDVNAYAAQNSLSTELAARELRYKVFEKVNKGVIATAHNADDNMETLLFNLSRGTGIKGLCGIPPKRDICIRPLINVSRAEIEAFCTENGIAYVTDSTNLSDDYSRNKIRHNAVPVLKEINEKAVFAASRTCEQLRDDCDFLEQTARDAYSVSKAGKKLKTDNLPRLHRAVAFRVIKMYLKEQGICFDYSHIESIYNALKDEKSAFTLPGGIILRKNGNYLQCEENEETFPQYDVKLIYKTEDLDEKSDIVNNLLLKNTIDCDKIVGSLEIRTRKSGDRITLPARHVTKTLKKLFTEDKISAAKRDTLPVVADSEGVLWVYGYGVTKRARVTASTKNTVFVDCSEKGSERS